MMSTNLKDVMPATLKRVSERMNGLGLETGNTCNKHSRKIIQGRCTRFETVDYDEELGVYPIKMIMGPNGKEFCPVCRKQANDEKLYKEKVLPQKRRYEVKDTSFYFKNKSMLNDLSIQNATISNFKTVDDETERLKNKALEISQEIMNGSDHNYLFVGKVGRGKSHLAYAIAEKINVDSYKQGKAKRIVFISIPQMIAKIRHSYSLRDYELNTYKYKKEYFVDLARTCDLMIFDDLGAELGQVQAINPAANDITAILGEVFEARMRKPNIITTNLTAKQIKELYDVRVESRIMDGTDENIIVFANTTDKRKERV
ncbi:hypothetical protein K5X77_10085 (plasmid) [Vagococcus lutrae]|uniref:DnaA ATPase domain-containing protein n=1 Tax=Vagococcus lutrae TaxID=81947 RepID=UPI001C954469|nr:DnaA/Hda family protein [Vagococcus lutrae]QZN89760.1 hypothetical protein K5X77_10085 [Vagococcus lutrae]